MASNRIGRINEEIQRELSDLLRELKDPRVHKTMLSITRVETTPDLRYAKIYVSLLDKEYTKETLAGLKSSAGYLRRELGRSLQLRYTPAGSVRTGLAMTNWGSLFVSLRGAQRRGNLVQEVASAYKPTA